MSTEFAPDHEIDGLARTRRERPTDAAIAQLAGAQYGVVGRGQLRGLGFRRGAVETRLRLGRLHPVHPLIPGVYAVGHRALSRRGWWMAATLARPGAALSHWSAAALWEIRRTSRESMDLAVPSRSRSSRLLHCHLSVLPTDELTLVAGIPVTTVPRTIFDLAGAEPVDLVVSLIREAEYKQLHDSLSLWDLIERYPGRRGVRRVHAALERLGTSPPGRTASELEERFVRFLEHYRLPAPRLNDWISVEDGRFQVDCHWPSSRQIVELDGWQAHGTRSAFQADRRRDRALRAWGYSVTRITWLQLENEPEALAVDLRKLLGAPSPRQTIKSMV